MIKSIGGDLKKLFIILSLLLSLLMATVTDIDGNVYETVQIGNQHWMAENLKVTHYNNGSEILNITSNGDWGDLSIGAYGDYDNSPNISNNYGRLYNWFVIVDERGVCPEGWHIPSDEEFMTLEMFLGMSESEANSTGYRGTNEGSKLASNADLLQVTLIFGIVGI